MSATAMTLATVTPTLVTYPVSAQVTVGFTPDTITLASEDNQTPVFFSFDGTHDHGVLLPGLTNPVTILTAFTSVWLRLGNLKTGAAKVYITATLKA